MKFTIDGFQQTKLIEFGLDHTDSRLLRWFIDFHKTEKMVKIIHNGEEFYWVKYGEILNDLPTLGISNKEVIARRFKKMVNAGVLKFWLKKEGGTFTFYNIGVNYSALIYDKGSTQKSNGSTQKGEGSTLKSSRIDSKIEPGIDSKVDTKDPSFKINSSSKDPLKENPTKCIDDLSKSIFKELLNFAYENDLKLTGDLRGQCLNVANKLSKDKWSPEEAIYSLQQLQRKKGGFPIGLISFNPVNIKKTSFITKEAQPQEKLTFEDIVEMIRRRKTENDKLACLKQVGVPESEWYKFEKYIKQKSA